MRGQGHGFFNVNRNNGYFEITRDVLDEFLLSLGWIDCAQV